MVKQDPAKIARIAIGRRIHFLYKRAINKFEEDNKLRLEYIIYCMEHGSHKKAEDGLWNVLSKRPNDINLWLYTASITMEKRGIDATINVLTRSIRNVHNLKLYQTLLHLQIERAYHNFKNGLRGIDLSTWDIVIKHAIKRLPSHEVTPFILSLIDKMCKVMVSGKFRESLADFDGFVANINDILYEKSKVEPLISAYMWKVHITELLVDTIYFKGENTFEQLFTDILVQCGNDCFKIYLLCALLYYVFNEPDFFSVDGYSTNSKYLLTFSAEEMVKLYPNKTKLLLYYPEILIIANLSPYTSQPYKSLYISTSNLLVKTKEFIASNLNSINWDNRMEVIINELIQENVASSQELEEEKAICISAILQVLKSCGKNYKYIMDNLENISSGLLTIMLMIEDISLEKFDKFIKLKTFKITRPMESELLVEKMLQLTNKQYIIYELFDHFSEDTIDIGIEMALKTVSVKEIPSNLTPVVKLKLCEGVIKSGEVKNAELINLFSVHQNRLEAMEQLAVEKKVEVAGWLDYIEFSKKFQDMFPHKCGVPSPGVIYNKAVARLGPDFLN